MAEEEIKLRVYRFKPEKLDQTTVFIEEYGAGKSRITVRIWADAFTAWFGGHGENCTLEQFVIDSHASYIANALIWGHRQYMSAEDESFKTLFGYLIRITEAMQAEFLRATQPAKQEG